MFGIAFFFSGLLIGLLAFEIFMFVDAYKNVALPPNERVLWLVGMALIHPFVAMAYYLTNYSKRKDV